MERLTRKTNSTLILLLVILGLAYIQNAKAQSFDLAAEVDQKSSEQVIYLSELLDQPDSVDVDVENRNGVLTLVNDTVRDTYSERSLWGPPRKMYVFIAWLQGNPTINCNYWDYNTILSPGESVTYTVTGSERLRIQVGFYSDACKWRFKTTLRSGRNERRFLDWSTKNV